MTFLLLGSYERRKGQDVFLEAIGQIPERVRARAAFRMAGRRLETEFYEALATRAAELPNVELSGALEHDAALAATNSADVLVCASRDETLPIAILEAMSLGKAIVSTDVGGISEWLSDGEDALIVPAGRQRRSRAGDEPMPERTRTCGNVRRERAPDTLRQISRSIDWENHSRA